MKLITPLLYGFILFPITGISVGIEALLRNSGILGEYKGVLDLPTFFVFLISIITVGIPLFWVASYLIGKLEKTDNYSFANHFRQSILFYLLGIFSMLVWIINGLGNTEEDSYLLMWIGISIVGIATNYTFLRRVNGSQSLN